MIGPVLLPPDFLALGKWVIVAGEHEPRDNCYDMHPDLARAVRNQCRAAGIAFFFKQTARREPIPPDLLIREFPQLMRRG
jgi:protein gp37